MNLEPRPRETERKRRPERQTEGPAAGRALSAVELRRLARIYKVLSDPTRLRMVTALHQRETCVGELAALAGISGSAASHQLRRLKDLALVKSRRAGQTIYYSLDDHHVALLLEAGVRHIREDDAVGREPGSGRRAK